MSVSNDLAISDLMTFLLISVIGSIDIDSSSLRLKMYCAELFNHSTPLFLSKII